MSETVTLVSDKASNLSSLSNGVPTVIAFGTTGAGKSSVINMLPDDPAYPAEQAVAKASVVGVTAEVKPFHKIVNGRPFTILDTMGMGELDTGTAPTHLAIEGLYDHLVTSSTRVHLVLLVMKAGRMTSLDECNYLLARYLFGDEVPIALVLTHMDNMENKDTWWNEQENRGRLGLLQCVGVVSFVGRRNVLETFYNQSKEDLSKFMATQLRFGPGYKLQPKPRISILTAALAALMGKYDEAARFHAAMLDLLKSYDIADRHADPLASKIRVAAPLPVVVFVGAPASGKSTIINMLANDQNGAVDPPTSTSTPGDVQEHIKVVKGQRIRLLETPGIPLSSPSESNAARLDKGLRALRDSLVANPFGIRLIVLVAKVGKERLAPVDIHHYQLVRQLCGDRVPICLITVQSEDNLDATGTPGNEQLSFQKHIPLPIVSPGATQQQLDSSGRLVENTLATLIRSTVDSPVQPNLFNTLVTVATPPPPQDATPDPSPSPRSFSVFASLRKKKKPSTVAQPDVPGHQPTALAPETSVPGPRRVMVFGYAESGKTSVINMLDNAEPTRTGYKRLPRDSSNPTLFEVIEPTPEDFRDLFSKMRSGVHLFIFVMDAPRLTTEHKFEYRTAKILSQGQIPISLVVTHMDGVQNPDEWWNDSKHEFAEAGMHFAGTPACVTASRGPVIEPSTGKRAYDAEYDASIPKLEKVILDNALSTPYHRAQIPWIRKRVVGMAKLLGLKAPGFDEELYRLAMSCGASSAEAKQWANKILAE